MPPRNCPNTTWMLCSSAPRLAMRPPMATTTISTRTPNALQRPLSNWRHSRWYGNARRRVHRTITIQWSEWKPFHQHRPHRRPDRRPFRRHRCHRSRWTMAPKIRRLIWVWNRHDRFHQTTTVTVDLLRLRNAPMQPKRPHSTATRLSAFKWSPDEHKMCFHRISAFSFRTTIFRKKFLLNVFSKYYLAKVFHGADTELNWQVNIVSLKQSQFWEYRMRTLGLDIPENCRHARLWHDSYLFTGIRFQQPIARCWKDKVPSPFSTKFRPYGDGDYRDEAQCFENGEFRQRFCNLGL